MRFADNDCPGAIYTVPQYGQGNCATAMQMSEITEPFPLIDSASSITSSSVSLNSSLPSNSLATVPSSCLVARSIKALAQSLSLQLSARAFASLSLFIRTAYSRLVISQLSLDDTHPQQYTVQAARKQVELLFPLAVDWFDDWLLRIRNHQTTFHATENIDNEDASLFCCERLVKDYYSLLNLDVLLPLPIPLTNETKTQAPLRMKRNAVLAVLGLLGDLVTWIMQAGEVVLSERQTSSGNGSRMLREAEIGGILQCAPLFKQFGNQSESEPESECPSPPEQIQKPAEEAKKAEALHETLHETDLVEVIELQRRRINELEDEVVRLQHILQIILTKQPHPEHSQSPSEHASLQDLSVGNSLQTLR